MCQSHLSRKLNMSIRELDMTLAFISAKPLMIHLTARIAHHTTWFPHCYTTSGRALLFTVLRQVRGNIEFPYNGKKNCNRKFSCNHHLRLASDPLIQNWRSRVQLTHAAFDVKPRAGFMEFLFEIQIERKVKSMLFKQTFYN